MLNFTGKIGSKMLKITGWRVYGIFNFYTGGDMKKRITEEFEKFVETKKEVIENFSPPYSKKDVAELLWCFDLLGVNESYLNKKQMMVILDFVNDHIENSRQLLGLARIIESFMIWL